MGAFYLYRKDKKLNLERVKRTFKLRGFKQPTDFYLNQYGLLLYQKTGVDFQNYRSNNGLSVFVIGTLIYKGCDPENSLDQLLSDAADDNINFNELLGAFFALIFNSKQLYFFTDRAGIQDVYFSNDKQIISSSFMAVSESFDDLSLNLNALKEVLLTGNLIRPDTYFNEIHSFIIQKPVFFDHITQLDQIPYDIHKVENNGTKEQLISKQINILQQYYKDIKKAADNCGVVQGITGGLDSRILMALSSGNIENYQLYSTFKRVKTTELKVAEELCDEMNEPLFNLPVRFPHEMEIDEIKNTIRNNFYFYDGQIRSHHFLWEEINTSSYRMNILDSKKISFNGVGGEQYRNGERLFINKRNTIKWIFYDMIVKYAGNIVCEKDEIVTYTRNKIYHILNIDQAENKISKLHIKRYFNEIYNPSNRTLRNNIENQIAFFLSPFTDHRISFPAYKIIPHLGLSKSFEIEMIKKLDENIANIITDYGFKPSDGEPIKSRLLTYVKEFLPYKFFYRYYRKRKIQTFLINELRNNDPLFEKYIQNVERLNLGIKLNELITNEFLGPLVIFTGYFIEEYRHKLNH